MPFAEAFSTFKGGTLSVPTLINSFLRKEDFIECYENMFSEVHSKHELQSLLLTSPLNYFS